MTTTELRRVRAGLRDELSERLPALIRAARADLGADATVTDLWLDPAALQAAGVPAAALTTRLRVPVALTADRTEPPVLVTWQPRRHQTNRPQADGLAGVTSFDSNGEPHRSTAVWFTLPLGLPADAAAAYASLRRELLDPAAARTMAHAVTTTTTADQAAA